MKLNDADILRLLPEFMREDPAVKGLASGINVLIRGAGQKAVTARVWDQIDQLDDAQLDELAYELDIDWYSAELPIDRKRAIIKNSDLVHSRRGTKWAVEQVMADVFNGGTAQEWYKYGGKPFHFRVTTDYPLQSQDIVERFRELIAVTKPARAVLDSIEFAHEGTTTTWTLTKPHAIHLKMGGTALNL